MASARIYSQGHIREVTSLMGAIERRALRELCRVQEERIFNYMVHIVEIECDKNIGQDNTMG